MATRTETRAGKGDRIQQGIRLQKLLAAGGIASRRGAEELIRAGRVTVNGKPAGLGDRADPARDKVAVDGVAVRGETHAYWLLHKPRGVLSTRSDTRGRPTVLDLLPPRIIGSHRLFPVGRLDLDSEGLVLLTNDGEVAHALLHPSLGTEREYRVTVRGRLPAVAARRLARGIHLADGPTAPAEVGPLRFVARRDVTELTLTLVEGRNRQIRRALLALGHPVMRLVRVRMGPLRLGRMAAREARPLSTRERAALLRHAGERAPGPPPKARKPRAGGRPKPRSGRPKGRPEASCNALTYSRI